MSERRDVELLAQRVLDRPYADPDDDLAILARQFLRRGEVIERMEKHLVALQDPTLDMIQANRDTILRIHEEGLQRVRKLAEYVFTSVCQSDTPPPIVVKDLVQKLQKILQTIEAVNTFHPMHGESWSGWPKE